MLAGFVTNRGRYRELNSFYRGQNTPGGFHIGLVKSAAAPTVDTNLWSDVSGQEIAAGNGYTANGISVARNTTDWDVLTEDDTNDRALVQFKNIVWTASGGPSPAPAAAPGTRS